MSQFHQQLVAARKAKAMTQEHLAQAVHISRSRVSRWETGEAVPDVEMIRRLSEVLECDLLTGVQTAPAAESPVEPAPDAAHAESPAEESAPEPDEPAPAAESSAEPVPTATAAAEAYEPYSMAWYQQEQTPVEGQAFVRVYSAENPVKAIRFEDFTGGVGWFYNIRCEETNGVAFTVTKLTLTVFNPKGRDDEVFEGDMLLQVMQGDLVLRTDRPMRFEFGGGFPLQSVPGVGLAVEGVDANGNQLVFRGYVELSQEIAE